MKQNLLQMQKAMRITLLIFSIVFSASQLLFAVNGRAQLLEQRISITLDKGNLYQAIKKLEKTSKTEFAFDNAMLNMEKFSIPSHNFKQTRLADILEQLFNGTNIGYKEERSTSIRFFQKQKPGKIRGKITDDKGGNLPGVGIKVIEANKSFTTDSLGNYSISLPAGKYTLEITYISFKTQRFNHVEIRENMTTTLNVVMMEQAGNLDEVVVIGYGTVKKSDLTGSVSVIKMKDIENVPVVRVDQMLQGRIAGAEIVSTSGEPGAGTSVRIRGTRSISATNEPLYVVDGVLDAVNSLNDLNPSDIESIQVLKDASSTAIYGSRGSNGVILITTKTGGTNGKTSFTFRSDVGQSVLPRFLDLMNATEFAELQNDRFYFSSTANQSKPLEEYPYKNPLALGEGTNWTKEITRTAPYQNHTFSMSGGDKSTNYYFSANYNNTEGIILSSGMKRIQSRLNLDKTFNKYVKSGVRLNYSYINQDVNKVDVGTSTLWYRSTVFLAPTIAAYKPDGTLNDFNTQWYSGTLFDSPLANSLLQKKDQVKKTLSSMLYVEVSPLKSLKLKSSVSFYDYNRFDDTFYPSTLPTRMSKNTGAYAYKRGFKDNNILNENTISYKKVWNKRHNLDAVYGITFQTFWTTDLYASGDGYFIDDIETNDLTAVPTKETLNAGSSLERQNKVSNLARVNYNYNGKYYLTVTARADAASNFAANHKWGYFPSAAVKWNILKEDFMKPIKGINELAIRLSGGVSGNDAISKYQSLSRLASNANGYIFGGVTPVAYYPTRISNEGLTWEKTTSYNVGLDLAILKNRLAFTFDAYSSATTDLLLTVQLPTHVGYTSRLTNIGKTSNKGVELAIDAKNISSKNFSWSTTLTLAHNRQMVEDIGGLDRISAYNNGFGAQYMMYGYIKGQPLNALWGMQYAGVWKSQAEITQNQTDKQYASSAVNFYQPGRQRYIDQNHDGILDNSDLVYLGNADPKLYGGIQNNFNIYGFNLGFYLNYSIGGKIYNPVELFMGTGTYLSNQFKYMVNAWHPVRNPNSDYPRADSKDDIPNDRFVHSASFLRLKNASIGYSFNLVKPTNNLLKSLTLTASGNNIYLWKYYNGYDPEVSTESEGSTIRRMDNGAYPNSRTVTFSAELKF